MITVRFMLPMMALLAAGCSPTGSLSPQPGDEDGGLVTAIGIGATEWLVLDFANGSLEPRLTALDLRADPAANGSRVLLRRIPAATVTLGATSGDFGAQIDETPTRSVAVGEFFLAVTELTQAQWVALAGTRPWLAEEMAGPGGGLVADGAPAYGLSADLVTQALASWRQRHSLNLRMPSDNEWERACRAGSTTTFAWGEAHGPATVALHAVVAETRLSAKPREVASTQANALDLYDLHGNVWELVEGGWIRGGSWFDSLPAARAANRVDLPSDVDHPLVGVRLVLEP